MVGKKNINKNLEQTNTNIDKKEVKSSNNEITPDVKTPEIESLNLEGGSSKPKAKAKRKKKEKNLRKRRKRRKKEKNLTNKRKKKSRM